MEGTTIISHDGGVDDLLVWFLSHTALAASGEQLLNVPGEGCTNLHQALENAQRFHACVGPGAIVSPGYAKRVMPPRVERFFGTNGFNDQDLLRLVGRADGDRLPVPNHFPATFPSTVQWLETGPCTNLAGALSDARTNLAQKIERVVVMGCVFEPPGLVGNRDPDTGFPYAEFNTYHDAKALNDSISLLNERGIVPTIVPWDECRKVCFRQSELAGLVGTSPVSEALRVITAAFFKLYGSDLVAGQDEPVYAMADVVAWYAFRGRFGRTTVHGVQIIDDVEDPRYGASYLAPESKLRVQLYRVENVDLLKAQAAHDLGWMPR